MLLTNMLLVAVGVSADAFAVGIGRGLSMRRLLVREGLRIALVFGLFQAAMPLVGWALGAGLEPFIAPFDHWVAFAILTIIGGRMLWEAFHNGDSDAKPARLSNRELLVLALATSVDALAVGIGLAILEVPILLTVILIGVVTAVLTFGGVVIGHRLGGRSRTPAEVVGGVVLIGIGLKILVEHLVV